MLNILFLFCLRSSSRRKVAPLSTNYCAYIRRRRLQRLLSSPTRQKSSSDLQLSLNLSGVIRLRYELMCLISGKNNDGEIHPLIFCPSFMRKRLAFSFCCAFLSSAKVPSRVPRDLVGPITARLELTSRWLEEASLRGRRSHSRPPHSHLLRPRVAGRDFPPGNTSGSLSTLLPGTVPGGRWPEGPPTLRTHFSFTPFRARPQTHFQLSPNPNPT